MMRKLVALSGACLCLLGHAADSASVPAIDTLIAPNTYRFPVLSPSGARYAVVMPSDSAETLVTVELATGKAEPAMKTTEGRIIDLYWKGESDLVLFVRRHTGDTEFHTFHLGDRESKQPAALRRWFAVLVNILPDDPEHILIATPAPNSIIDASPTSAVFLRGSIRLDANLSKLNIRTGKAEPLVLESNFVNGWVTDRAGSPIALFGRFQERWFMIFTETGGRPRRRVDLGDKNSPDFLPFTLSPDGRRIVGLDLAAHDTATLIAWDPTNDQKEVLLLADGYDVLPAEGGLHDRVTLFAVDRAGGPSAPLYLDPTVQETQSMLAGALPNATNQIVSLSTDKSRAIVLSATPQHPGSLYLFDRQKKRLTKLGSLAPKITPSKMGESRLFSCQSRDGLALHGRLTLPPGSKTAVPAVVLVAELGARTGTGFDPLVQILSTRGYAVVQVDHRGKPGYGAKFSAAGDLQVTTGIPDDLVDAVDWLAGQGLIDAKRVALFGSQSGGLVAFHAAARHPNSFTVLINDHTPMDPARLKFTDFVFSRFSETELKEKFGGEAKQLDYLKSLDPLIVLAQIRAATFHYYAIDRRDRSYFAYGDKLKKRLGPDTPRTRFVTGAAYANFEEYLTKWDANVREQQNRFYAEVLSFLSANIGGR